uniref:Pickpocket protein 28 n=1 Tax=Dendroctonus ponderosae TaxID=77166 RepID=A0AAR5Q842_DENPD
MVRSEETIIRPRKPVWMADPTKARVPIFQIVDNDFGAKRFQGLSSQSLHPHHPVVKEHKAVAEASSVKKLRKTVVNQLEKYCENTTLHGLRYIGDSHLTFGERIFWFISFSFAIGFAAYYISNIYEKWKSSPVITSFSPFDADLSSIPFPAITICNMNQAKKNEAERILREGQSSFKGFGGFFEPGPICRSDVEKKLLDDSCNGNASFDITENISWQSLRDFLVKVGNSCSDMLKSCQWGSQYVDCDEVFNNDLTDEGLCCSFNRLPPSLIFRNLKDISILNQTFPNNVYDWNAEKGFEDAEYGEFTIPRRPLGAGAHLGLSVVLDAQVANYHCSSTRSIGFKVILANPIETPKMADFGFLISPGFETRVTIEPSVREATETLRDVAVQKRQCYFSNERPLQYYRFYSQRNCLLECQSNYTLNLCECVPYYLPKNKQIKYCGKIEKFCVETAKNDMETVVGNGSNCNCLPSCFSTQYTDLKSYAKLSDKISTADDFPPVSSTYFTQNMAVVQFYFYNSKFTKELKSQLYGFTEILSNVGGLLSLCLGFSFLSLVEIFYFITLRLCCEVFHRKVTRNQKQSLIPFLR